jgi:hypothetical protein
MTEIEFQTAANQKCHSQNDNRQLEGHKESIPKIDDGKMLAIQQAWASYQFLVKTQSNIENTEIKVKLSMASNMR